MRSAPLTSTTLYDQQTSSTEHLPGPAWPPPTRLKEIS
jgi:hypothetical protein